jgi:ATP-binding cassette subfamily B protein
MAVKIEKDMRRLLFYNLQTLTFRFFDNRETDEFMSRMINDIGRVTDAVSHAPQDIFLAFTMIAGSNTVLFVLNWKPAMICSIPIPTMTACSGLLGGRLRRGFEGINAAIGEINELSGGRGRVSPARNP